MTPPPVVWRRSTHCGANGTCVVLATNATAISDSAHPGRPTILLTPHALRALIHAIKDQP